MPIAIRAYVVGFGDCILLRLPDGNRTRHVLVDFGRAPNDPTSLNRFPAIAQDIARECNGHLDLIVVTHEHLDHMEGFYRERDIFDRMDVDQVWMGLPSEPSYYSNYPNAKLQKRLQASVGRFASDARRAGMTLHPTFRSLLENNLANKDRIEYLRTLGKKNAAYLARGKATAARGWSKNIRVKVLAPEPDVSVYYSANAHERALTSALMAINHVDEGADDTGIDWTFPKVRRAGHGGQAGFSESEFGRLRRAIREDGVAAARFIDHAQNNTSLCLLVEIDDKRLLLPGDAELESWDMMRKKCSRQLKPVNFMKVSHHGSHNGTPLDMLDTLLPVKNKSNAKVLVSTKRNVYGTKNPVPDTSLLTELERRCSSLVTTDGRTGTYVDLEI